MGNQQCLAYPREILFRGTEYGVTGPTITHLSNPMTVYNPGLFRSDIPLGTIERITIHQRIFLTERVPH